eukprot:Polyplicarium_translucidae@DN3937_c0_g1_i1.p1
MLKAERLRAEWECPVAPMTAENILFAMRSGVVTELTEGNYGLFPVNVTRLRRHLDVLSPDNCLLQSVALSFEGRLDERFEKIEDPRFLNSTYYRARFPDREMEKWATVWDVDRHGKAHHWELPEPNPCLPSSEELKLSPIPRRRKPRRQAAEVRDSPRCQPGVD